MIMRHCWNYQVKQKLFLVLQKIMQRKQIVLYRLHLDKGKSNNHFVCDSFDYTVKKQGWMGGGTRSVKFVHAATTTIMVIV
jgi:hypothetical protein